MFHDARSQEPKTRDKEVSLTFFKALSCYFLWRKDAATQRPLSIRNSESFPPQLKQPANLFCQVLYTLSLSKCPFLQHVLYDFHSTSASKCRVYSQTQFPFHVGNLLLPQVHNVMCVASRVWDKSACVLHGNGFWKLRKFVWRLRYFHAR